MTKRTDLPAAGLSAEILRDIMRHWTPRLQTFTTLEACYAAVEEDWYDTEAWGKGPLPDHDSPNRHLLIIEHTCRDDMEARLLEAGFVPKVGTLGDGEHYIEGWSWP